MSRKKQAAKVLSNAAAEPDKKVPAPVPQAKTEPLTPATKPGSKTSVNSFISYLNFALFVLLTSLLLSNIQRDQRVETFNEPPQSLVENTTAPTVESSQPIISTSKPLTPAFPSRRKVHDSFCIAELRNANLKGSIAVTKIRVQAKHAKRICSEMFQYPTLATIKNGVSGQQRGVMNQCGKIESVVIAGESLDGKCRILYKDGILQSH
jgi:hypothetical protein